MLFLFNRHYVRSMQAGWENHRSGFSGGVAAGSRWCVSDPLPPSAALPLTEGLLISPS